MQYILYILSIIFLYINYKIIKSDLKEKIIPNRNLLQIITIVPIYYIYVFFSIPEINYIIFFLQIFITFLVSFTLYYFGIWAAGDAKYLLILSLLIPYIGIINFIGNIALITIFYLFGYFIWFYFGKCIVYKGYAIKLLNQIKNDLLDKWNSYKQDKKGNNFLVILKFLTIFTIIFVSLRITRIYLFSHLMENGENIEGIKFLIDNYGSYIILGTIVIFIGIVYLFIGFINKIKIIIYKKLKIEKGLISNILVGILFIILSSFIIKELIYNPREISNALVKVFTIYLGFYIIFKILFYSYKITFGIAETNYINIDDLKEGDIIDKNFLVKIFGIQKALGYSLNQKEKGTEKEKLLLYPNPKNFFNSIDRSISKDQLEIVKKCYKIVDDYHKKQETKNYNSIKHIKVLNTFPFSPYILSGFVVTFVFEDKIFKYLLNSFFEIIKSIY